MLAKIQGTELDTGKYLDKLKSLSRDSGEVSVAAYVEVGASQPRERSLRSQPYRRLLSHPGGIRTASGCAIIHKNQTRSTPRRGNVVSLSARN